MRFSPAVPLEVPPGVHLLTPDLSLLLVAWYCLPAHHYSCRCHALPYRSQCRTFTPVFCSELISRGGAQAHPWGEDWADRTAGAGQYCSLKGQQQLQLLALVRLCHLSSRSRSRAHSRSLSPGAMTKGPQEQHCQVPVQHVLIHL
jgi:hypothetical protein